MLAVVLFLSACNLQRPDVTLTLAPIDTRTPVATELPDAPTATRIPSASPAMTSSVTVTIIDVTTATSTPTPSATASATVSPTATPISTATPTRTSTDASSATSTFTVTNTPSATSTPTASASATATSTPSNAATAQPTATQSATATDTLLPTSTYTSLPTDTPMPTLPPTTTDTTVPTNTSTSTSTLTEAPTATRTSSPVPPPTLTATVQPSPTRILPATPTQIATPTPTITLAVSLPQQAEEETPTDTVDTLLPDLATPPPRPTLDETEVWKLLATRPPRPAPPATGTAESTDLPTGTPLPTAPADATSGSTIVLATQESGDTGPRDERSVVSTPQSQDSQPSPPPSPTVFQQPTVEVRRDLLQPVIQPIVPERAPFTISDASVFEFSVGQGQVFTFEDIQLADGVRLFLPNPVDSTSFLRTDFKGVLRYRPLGAAQEEEMGYPPYFQGSSGAIDSIDQNKNRIVELDWSADGRQFSFRIDPPQGTDNGNAGVWFWHPQAVPAQNTNFAIIHDCPADGYNSCIYVHRTGPLWHWKTIGVQWSPIVGNNSLLLTLQLPQEGRNALAVAQAVTDRNYAGNLPAVVRYDYGAWNPDGNGITVSGRRPDGRVIIGAVDNNLQGERIILDASARGLWLRDAVRLPNGQVVALGRPGAPQSGPVALYDQFGEQISAFIGNAPPEDVRWYPDRSAVVVSVQGRQHTVQVAGGAVEDASDLAANPQFGAETVGVASGIPNAVIQDTEYYPGQQLRIAIPFLNVRGEPTTTSGIVSTLQQGDYVAIFAGPYENEGYRWWRIQTSADDFGWIAGTIDGAPTVRPL